MELPYAEDIGHYWQTGQASPDEWIERARKLIKELGGTILQEAFGSVDNHAAFMLKFELEDSEFKVVWPVLPSRSGKTLAAKRQAATLLYHDIKAKAMTATVLGNKTAFFSYLMLRDGRAASELATPELAEHWPLQLRSGK